MGGSQETSQETVWFRFHPKIQKREIRPSVYLRATRDLDISL